jgi:hypothetical protein
MVIRAKNLSLFFSQAPYFFLGKAGQQLMVLLVSSSQQLILSVTSSQQLILLVM